MEIGIIAEGRVDQVVIRNILYAFGVEKEHIHFLRPELAKDGNNPLTNVQDNNNNAEADKAFGSWTNVVNDCKEQTSIADFFKNPIAGNKFLIIQLDSDVCSQYGVQEVFSPKNSEDFIELRRRIVAKIDEWLKNKYQGDILYAICIRQMDAWVLTIFAETNDKDTGTIASPKDKLKGIEQFKKLRGKSITVKYEEISDVFSKKKKLKKYLPYNQSLREFVESLEKII
jgi:hypothetical protein